MICRVNQDAYLPLCPASSHSTDKLLETLAVQELFATKAYSSQTDSPSAKPYQSANRLHREPGRGRNPDASSKQKEAWET